MKLFFQVLIICSLLSCQISNDMSGRWFSPNGLIEIDLSKDNTYTVKFILGTNDTNGTWKSKRKKILLDDSFKLEVDSGDLFLFGHRLSRKKPETFVQQQLNLSGNKFYWTFESDSLIKKDTISFNDTSYYSSYNQSFYQYKLILWNELLYFTDDNLSNLYDRFVLVESFDSTNLILDYYDNHSQKHLKWELIKL